MSVGSFNWSGPDVPSTYTVSILNALRLGIPVVPGSDGAVGPEDDALAIGKAIGFPVLVKAASGGGGRQSIFGRLTV